MKATIDKPMIFKAAGTLANGGYNCSMLQFVRLGDKLEICGTNAYVMVLASVPAKFNRWPDGDGFRFGGAEVRALMRGTSKALKDADTVQIETSKGEAAVTLSVDGTAVATSFPYADPRPPIHLDQLKVKCGEGPDGKVKPVGVHFMSLASTAMRTIAASRRELWVMKEHGEGNPVEFISKEEPARVLVMPGKD